MAEALVQVAEIRSKAELTIATNLLTQQKVEADERREEAKERREQARMQHENRKMEHEERMAALQLQFRSAQK